MYHSNDLVETAKEWRQETVSAYASSPHSGGPARDDIDGRTRARSGGIRCGAMSLAGWSDAANGDQSEDGKCRRGFVIGLMSSTLNGPCHII